MGLVLRHNVFRLSCCPPLSDVRPFRELIDTHALSPREILLTSKSPHKFHGLLTIGKIIFIIDLVMFFACCALIIACFIGRPESFPDSLRDPAESFYVGAFWVSIALILENVSQYGVPYCGAWLSKTLQVLFWFYVASILFVAIFQYYSTFVSQNLRISDMTPAWM